MDQIINGILENPEFKNNSESERKVENSTFEDVTVNQDVNASIAALLRRSLPRVQMIGVGGAGNNSTARLMKSNIEDVEVLAINTDAQDLLNTLANKKVLVGYSVTRGFGAGNDPNIGESAARESSEELKELVTGDLVFITAGLGGGTGTGAAHVVAELAKDKGALTVSICTLPFNMEGPVRKSNALHGLKKLYHASDTVIVVPNQRLLTLSPDLSLMQGFKIADEVLVRAVSAISELITKPQMVNLDFADVRKVLGQGGVAMIGLGESKGQSNKVEEAVSDALNNPLLEDLDLSTARKALICVSGGEDLSLRDAEQVVSRIQARIDHDAEIIWGASINDDLNDTLRVIALISDIDSNFEKEGIFQLQNDAEDIAEGLSNSTQQKNGSIKGLRNPLQALKKKGFRSLFKQ
ncbi:MAG: cell division protein FtsZ [Candidatus Hodarchaeales archaeon]|jgi:cell division protein FtsZ